MGEDAVRLFGSRERLNGAPSTHLEGTFEFLDRAAGDYWAQVRDRMDSWVANVPLADRRDIVARLRSPNDDQFNAAYLELYLHEMFLRSGFRVECHPNVGGSRRPDFRVAINTSTFYVEARHLVSRSDSERGRGRRIAAIYDALNQMSSPNFFIWVKNISPGPQELPKRAMIRAAERWLETLDPDQADARIRAHGLDCLDEFEWHENGWLIQLRPVPIAAEYRGRPGLRPLGIYGGGEASFIDNVTPLRVALRDKGSAYGGLDEPFVIAAGVGWLTGKDDRDVMAALYGSEQILVSSDPDVEPQPHRGSDGYWYGGSRWLHTNVSGVLQVTNLHPAYFQRANPTLWLHPEPDRPIGEFPGVWRCLRPVGTKLEEAARTIDQAALFGIPDGWPIGEPFPDD